MGFIREFYIIVKMARTASILENVFETGELSALCSKPEGWNEISRKLISDAIKENPNVLNHSYGKNPTEISLACYALALGIRDTRKDEFDYHVITMAFCNTMAEIKHNERAYRFNKNDRELIKEAIAITKPLLKIPGDE